MRMRSTIFVAPLFACLACAGDPIAEHARRLDEADEVLEQAIRITTGLGVLSSHQHFCISTHWPESARPASAELMRRFASDARRFTTQRDCRGRPTSPLLLSSVTWIDAQNANVQVTFLCGVEGCSMGYLSLTRSSGSWRVIRADWSGYDFGTLL